MYFRIRMPYIVRMKPTTLALLVIAVLLSIGAKVFVKASADIKTHQAQANELTAILAAN